MGVKEKILNELIKRSKQRLKKATTVTIDKVSDQLLIGDMGGSIIVHEDLTGEEIKTLDGWLVCGLKVIVLDTEEQCLILD